jgi:site-specific recombinase XerD
MRETHVIQYIHFLEGSAMSTDATVTALHLATGDRQRGPVLISEAVEAFLATPRASASPNTHRAYTDVLHRIAGQLGPTRALADVDEVEIGTALSALWNTAAPTTFNRNRAAVGSWLAWCTSKAKWTAPTIPATCERRKEPQDQTRAVDRALIERICTRRDIPLRERMLWRMLYETASRASAVLALNIEDCDFDNRRARVTVKGGHTEWIIWGRGAALLLPRHLHGRHTGPLFCSERLPGPGRRAATATRDICPETGRVRLGYDRARVLIKQHTGLSLHTLRHSAATHLGDSGADTTIIMAKGHWRSIRTAARYTKPGLAAITTATELLDPPHRRT